MKISIENRARLAFALLVLLGAAAGTTWYVLTSGQYTTYQLHTEDSVSGLIADAPVEFHGVEVGKVERIELVVPHTVRVLLSVRKEVPISVSTVATITSRGLATRGFTGYVYVALEDSGADATPLAASPGNPYPLIRTAASRSVSLDTAISQVNDNVQAVTDLLRTTLDKQTIVSFKQAVDNLQQVTGMLEANNRKLATIISNAEQASNRLDPLLQSGTDTINTLQQQILPEAYTALANVDRLSTSLNSLTAKINRDPSLLVRGTVTPPGPGESK